MIEAMWAFVATERQLLWKPQLSLTQPAVLAAINQTLMISLSMVVIGSMIAVGGMSKTVLRGIGRLVVGRALASSAIGIMLDVSRIRRRHRSRGRARPSINWGGDPQSRHLNN
ncbi:hypothetical protein [Mesorhizobium sp.]|uniref:hypothetical protein n=1 Tax=Mesorhizobium sp. TaxID=1871066 RepID=UPI000FE5993E|nr:hypothetical protein [Mesorhizobium sp.]RWB65974.1 MAG: hypothetical protein EOQ49_30275 [Mesorhizobium sp.]RWF26084.1 MAG: hypothetical protein EOS64_02530 [Mesorhizobium sp.]TIT13553.1 MAG: hypothetical protein E5W74_05875 [Mesorhizobium sp.]TIV82842.1 MAG: hypothetical protein E5V64_10360 [Mesorhizobium sp.]TIV99297.1 MAG: hypothetical protein E5V85_08230 [Mesorhizobium sp.]